MKVCPVCEGYTSSRLKRCSTCDVPMVDLMELAWGRRDDGAAAASPWIGHLVGGKYRITGVLGRGGMGTVYRAVHELSLSPSAVKVLHPRFAHDVRFRDLLMAEARRASRVRGEHIAQVLDVGETQEGSIYIAMELVEGETLQTFLAREGCMKPAWVLTLLDLSCRALEEMGRAGLVHRDVSPSNLMLTRRGRNASLKILDLGIAQIPEEKDPQVGTGLWINPPYTAPEVLAGESGTQQSDLYSLGVVAYQALTGNLPHGGETTQDRVQAVLTESPAPMELPRGTPRRLGSLIRRLMSRDPAARPQSATEVLERIRSIRRPKRPLQRAASIAIFLVGVVLLTLSLTQRPEATLLPLQGSIRISSLLPDENASPEACKLEDLRQQTFETHGIGPGDLVLDCLFFQDGSRGTYSLEGRRKGRDLSFSLQDTGWRDFFEAVSARGGKVALSFRMNGRSLAHARLFVDREAPSFADASLEGRGGEQVLLRDSVFTGRVVEDGPWVKATFRLLDSESRPLAKFTRELPGSGPLRVELGKVFSGSAGTAEGEPAILQVRLEDGAGRQSPLISRLLKHVDLSLPEIREAVSAEGNLDLLLAGERCEILLRLSSVVVPKDISRVLVQVGAGTDGKRDLPFDVEEGKIRVHVDLPILPDREKVLLEFQLVDGLGNRSKIFAQTFGVQVLDLESRFSSRPLSAGAQAPFRFSTDGRSLLLERPPFLLVYECNAGYEPRLQTAGLPDGVRLEAHKTGFCTVHLGMPLDPQARFVLRFQHRNVQTGRLLSRTRDLEVRLLPKGPSFVRRADWLSGEMWSGHLVQSGLLEAKSGDEFRILLLTSLALDLPAQSEAKAWLWREGPEGWIRIVELSNSSPLVVLDRGHNRFALEAVDDLGRTLLDKAGLRARALVGKSLLLPFLDVLHDSRRPRSHDIFFEYGSPVRLVLDFPQAFAPGTRVRLTPSWQGADSGPAIVFDLQPTTAGGSRGSVLLDFDRVRRWCGLEGVTKSEFGGKPLIKRRFRIVTPAGEYPDLVLGFQPTRSLLRVQDLAALARARGRPVQSHQKMVPFLGTEELMLGLSRSRFRDLPGTLLVDEPIRVIGLGEFFLGQTEVSRADYLRFVQDVLASKEDTELIRQLGHAEDPLGKGRFTKVGLMPLEGHFPGMGLEALALADGERPVTGVDYYQASAYCRWLSVQVFGNPDMFRLPFAAELVQAAVHRFPRNERVAHLNGLHVPAQKWKSVEEAWRLYRKLSRRGAGLDPAHWPLSPKELQRVGDYCVGIGSLSDKDGASRCYGIDFGVREWVEDLPLDAGKIVRIYIGSHSEHVRLSRDRRLGKKETLFTPEVSRLGVIRGLAFAEPAFRGRDPQSLGYLEVRGGGPAVFGDPDLLGVRRTENAKRDGILSGDRKNPFLGVVGFRIAGTRRFMEKARMGTQ